MTRPVHTCSRGQACALLGPVSIPHCIQESELAFQFGLVWEGAAEASSLPRESWESFLAGVTADRLSPGWGAAREGAWGMGTFCRSISWTRSHLLTCVRYSVRCP